MNIRLHIERVVLDGVPVENPHVLRQTLEHELTRRLAEGGLSQKFRTGGAIPHLRGGTIQLSNGQSVKELGVQVARNLHRGIGVVDEQPSGPGSGRSLSGQLRRSEGTHNADFLAKV